MHNSDAGEDHGSIPALWGQDRARDRRVAEMLY